MDPAHPVTIEAISDDDPGSRAFDPRHSLRARAILVFGGGALAFCATLWWIAGTLVHRHLESAIGPSFETLAYQIGD